mgnify:CR=1 FL=1
MDNATIDSIAMADAYWKSECTEGSQLAWEVGVVLKSLQDCFANGGIEPFKGDGDTILVPRRISEEMSLWVFKEAMNQYDQLKRNKEWAEKEYPYFHK